MKPAACIRGKADFHSRRFQFFQGPEALGEQFRFVVNREFHITFHVGDGQKEPWFRDNQFKRNVVTWETWHFIRGDDVIDVDVPPAATMAIDDFEANAFAFQFINVQHADKGTKDKREAPDV